MFILFFIVLLSIAGGIQFSDNSDCYISIFCQRVLTLTIANLALAIFLARFVPSEFAEYSARR